MRQYQSWGRYPRVNQEAVRLTRREAGLPLSADDDRRALPFGNGRSYGDSCLNDGGLLLDCRGLDHFMAFDRDSGVLRCEAGVLLSEILPLIVPAGWFLPVTPGTKFVTVGGAIANDVHGKNHHRAGTFGRHVNCLELLRSDGTRMLCSPEQNADWFAATIGGLGLTGVITWAEIQLVEIHSPFIDEEIIRFDRLENFFTLAEESDAQYDHTVAWIDCLATGSELGRGLFIRGNHAARAAENAPKPPKLRLAFPIDLPFPLVNKTTLKAFNTLYYNKQRQRRNQVQSHYEPFFYPLDSISDWNRIYGSKGFMQFQCVVPQDAAPDALKDMLRAISTSGLGSFLAVLKLFGDKPSPGILSFPRPGATLALDFPNRGEDTRALLSRLEHIAVGAEGALYPAKDALMRGATFTASFPNWPELEPFIDPRFSSSFWRRVTSG